MNLLVRQYRSRSGRAGRPGRGCGDGGFTLIELIMGITILTIIAVILAETAILGYKTTTATGDALGRSAASQAFSELVMSDVATANHISATAPGDCSPADGSATVLSRTGPASPTGTATATATYSVTQTAAGPGTGPSASLERLTCHGAAQESKSVLPLQPGGTQPVVACSIPTLGWPLDPAGPCPATTTLSATVAPGASALTLSNGTGFPLSAQPNGPPYSVTVDAEVLTVTGTSTAAGTQTLYTYPPVAVSHTAGAPVMVVLSRLSGIHTTLLSGIGTAETSVTVADISAFPDPAASPYQILVDAEPMTVTGPISGNTIPVQPRTNAVAHTAGAPVLLIPIPYHREAGPGAHLPAGAGIDTAQTAIVVTGTALSAFATTPVPYGILVGSGATSERMIVTATSTAGNLTLGVYRPAPFPQAGGAGVVMTSSAIIHTTLVGGAGTTDTAVTLASLGGFPLHGPYNIAVDSEPMLVTDTTVGGTTANVYRPSPATHAPGAPVLWIQSTPEGVQSTLAADVAVTDTAMTVTETTTGPTFATATAVPYRILVDSELVTVTAVTPNGATTTLGVTRSGSPVTHTMNAPVILLPRPLGGTAVTSPATLAAAATPAGTSLSVSGGNAAVTANGDPELTVLLHPPPFQVLVDREVLTVVSAQSSGDTLTLALQPRLDFAGQPDGVPHVQGAAVFVLRPEPTSVSVSVTLSDGTPLTVTASRRTP